MCDPNRLTWVTHLYRSLYAWLCEAIEAEDDPDQKLGLQRVRSRFKLHLSTQRGWLEAARLALAGDVRAIRGRVEMHDAGPVELVLSWTLYT